MREATPTQDDKMPAGCISTHTSRAGGDYELFVDARDLEDISIHTSRAGGDLVRGEPLFPYGISIHTSRAGGDGRSRFF